MVSCESEMCWCDVVLVAVGRGSLGEREMSGCRVGRMRPRTVVSSLPSTPTQCDSQLRTERWRTRGRPGGERHVSTQQSQSHLARLAMGEVHRRQNVTRTVPRTAGLISSLVRAQCNNPTQPDQSSLVSSSSNIRTTHRHRLTTLTNRTVPYRTVPPSIPPVTVTISQCHQQLTNQQRTILASSNLIT